VGYRFAEGDVARLTALLGARPVGQDEGVGLAELSLPVRVRGQVVGEIKAHKPGDADEWTAAEVELMETLAEQLDMALESARLYEDTQDRATRDRLLGDVSTRIRETLDMETVLRSVRKTGRVIVVHEDVLFGGFGAEVAARIADAGFEHLDAPVRRYGGKNTPIPYNWFLEEQILPQTPGILKALEDLAEF